MLAWWVDGSSLNNRRGDWPVHAVVRCADRADLAGPGVHAVGVAVEVYSRKAGFSSWGHVSLRTVACRDGVLEDREYETYGLTAWNRQSFEREHAGEPFLAQLDQDRGALVLFRNVDPVDYGWFGDAESHNREIYELWLDLPQAELDRIVVGAADWYDAQTEQLRAGAVLPDRYRPLSTNCTTVLARLLGVDDPPSMPYAWLRRLDDRARLRVLHPSHDLVARWGGVLPTQVGRPHRVFRHRHPLPADLVVGEPVGPWLGAEEGISPDPPLPSPAAAGAGPSASSASPARAEP